MAASPVLVAACQEFFIEPASSEASASLAFSFAPELKGGPAEAFDRAEEARFKVSRSSEMILDTIVRLSPPGAERTVRLGVASEVLGDLLDLHLELLWSGRPLFEGRTEITLTEPLTSVEVAIVPVPDAVQLFESSALIDAIGDTVALGGAVLFATGDTLPDALIEYSTLNPAVASVTAQGVVTAENEGEATVVARHGVLLAETRVTVRATVAGLEITPALVQLRIGSQQQLTAIALDANGNILIRTPAWRSSSAGVARVSMTGLLHGVSPGEATITATVEAASASVHATVFSAPIASVTVQPAATTLQPGELVQLRAIVRDTEGSTLPNAVVAWTSSDARSAGVDPSGLVTAFSGGQVTIMASIDGISGTAMVTVEAPVIQPSPASVHFVASPNQSGLLQDVSITNAGTGTLSGLSVLVSYGESQQDWLDFQLNPAGMVLSIVADAAGLAEDTYTATLTISSDIAGVRPYLLPVTLTVSSTPVPTITILGFFNPGTQTPVATGNASSAIDVSVRVNVPAGATVSAVETVVASTELCEEAVNLSGPATADVTCTIDTAAYDLGTGIVQLFNGPHILSVRALDGTGSVSARADQTVVLNNVNFIVATASSSGGTVPGGAGLAAPGVLWHHGDINVDLLAVNYGSASSNVVSVTVGLLSSGAGVTGVAGCVSTDQGSSDPTIAAGDGGAGGASSPGCASVGAARTVNYAGPTTVVFPATADLSQRGVALVEDIFSIWVNSVTAGGQAGPVCVNPHPVHNPHGPSCSVYFPDELRIDNLAPRIAAIDVVRSSQWFGSQQAQVQVGTGCASSPCAVVVDYGSGIFAAGGADFLAGTTANDLQPFVSMTQLPQSSTNTAYVAAVSAVDAAGNQRLRFATPTPEIVSPTASGTQNFGVDHGSPTLAVLSGPPDGSANTLDVRWVLQAFDPGTGPSGLLPGAVSVRLERILPSGTACHDPTTSVGVSCSTMLATDSVVHIPPVLEGYWRLSAFATDAAGNTSSPIDVTTLVDITDPIIGPIGVPPAIPGNSSPNFGFALTDNVALGDVRGAVSYGGGLDFAIATQVIGAFGTTVAGIHGNLAAPAFVRSLETVLGGGVPSGAVAPATGFGVSSRDVARLTEGIPCFPFLSGTGCAASSVDISAAVAAPVGGTFPSFTTLISFNVANPAHGLFQIQNPSQPTVCNNPGGIGCAPSSPPSTGLSATVTGPAAVFASPFSSVTFYAMESGHSPNWQPVGTATVAVSDNTVLNTRTYTFSAVWTPAGLPPGNYTIVAVGVDANGSGLVSGSVNISVEG